MTLALLLLLAGSPAADPAPVAASTPAPHAIFLVRHAEKAKAEKGDKDPPLSAEGVARAERLAKHLSAAGIETIYATEYLRTKLTAQPLAIARKLTPVILDAKDPVAVAAAARRSTGNVLVVGHSNSLPDILQALGVEHPPEITDDQYDDLFEVIVGSGVPVFVRLRY